MAFYKKVRHYRLEDKMINMASKLKERLETEQFASSASKLKDRLSQDVDGRSVTSDIDAFRARTKATKKRAAQSKEIAAQNKRISNYKTEEQNFDTTFDSYKKERGEYIDSIEQWKDKKVREKERQEFEDASFALQAQTDALDATSTAAFGKNGGEIRAFNNALPTERKNIKKVEQDIREKPYKEYLNKNYVVERASDGDVKRIYKKRNEHGKILEEVFFDNDENITRKVERGQRKRFKGDTGRGVYDKEVWNYENGQVKNYTKYGLKKGWGISTYIKKEKFFKGGRLSAMKSQRLVPGKTKVLNKPKTKIIGLKIKNPFV